MQYGNVHYRVSGTVYWGSWEDQSPTGEDITDSWDSLRIANPRQSYNLSSDIAGNYWGIAIPTSMYNPDVIYAAGFSVGMVESDVEIDGIAYRLYMSPVQTEADELELEIR